MHLSSLPKGQAGRQDRERIDAARVGVLLAEEERRGGIERTRRASWQNPMPRRVNDQGHRLVTMHPAAFLRAILQVSPRASPASDAP